MRIIVCGARDWSDREYLEAMLDRVRSRLGLEVLVEGEARGADTMAREWAEARGVRVERFPANWSAYGRSAGPIRNREMLAAGADAVIAFHHDLRESKGTRHMVEIAREAGVPTLVLPSGQAALD